MSNANDSPDLALRMNPARAAPRFEYLWLSVASVIGAFFGSCLLFAMLSIHAQLFPESLRFVPGIVPQGSAVEVAYSIIAEDLLPVVFAASVAARFAIGRNLRPGLLCISASIASGALSGVFLFDPALDTLTYSAAFSLGSGLLEGFFVGALVVRSSRIYLEHAASRELLTPLDCWVLARPHLRRSCDEGSPIRRAIPVSLGLLAVFTTLVVAVKSFERMQDVWPAVIVERDDAQRIALHKAAESGKSTSLARFIADGVDVNAETVSGDPLLVVAAAAAQDEVVLYLLSKGARVDGHGSSGHTALMAAARADQVSLLKLLLSHGADINASDAVGNSALMYATKSGARASVRFLLSAGADRTIRNVNGETALSLAQSVSDGDPEAMGIVVELKRERPGSQAR